MSAGLIAITKGASVAGSGTLGAYQIPYANSAGELQGSSALTFNGTGFKITANFSVGGALNTWSVGNVAQINSASLFGDSGQTILSNNAYYNNGWKRYAANFANQINFASGVLIYNYAATGATDSAITWSEGFRVTSGGNFYVGTTGDGASRFMVSGGQFRVSSGSSPWFVMGSSLIAGSYGTFHKGNTTTAVGYIGTDGGGITGVGSGNNFGLRAEGALLLYSGGGSGSATLDTSGNLIPGTDNSQTLGSGSYRWSVVYAGTGTINTSDAREKTKVSLLEDKEIEAAAALSAEIGKFQFLSSIESKGEDKARIHLGMTVQRAIEIMEKNSLDPMRYAFICYDKWEEEVDAVEGEEGAYAITSSTQKTTTSQVEEKVIEVIDGVPTQKTVTKDVASPVYEAVPVVDEDGNPVVNITPAIEEELDEEGNVVKEAIPEQVVPVTYQVPVMETVTAWKKKVSKDRYGFRYDQLIMFIAKGLEARFTRAIQGLVG